MNTKVKGGQCPPLRLLYIVRLGMNVLERKLRPGCCNLEMPLGVSWMEKRHGKVHEVVGGHKWIVLSPVILIIFVWS